MLLIRSLFSFAVFLWSIAVLAEEPSLAPLPQPLSLEQALVISADHPSIRLAESGLAIVAADAAKVSADSALKITAKGYLTAIEPTDLSPNQSNNDSKAFLHARKRLYDFGYTEARESAAQTTVKSQQWQLLTERQTHQLNVMEKFFAVLVSDKNYVLKDEQMTLAYLKYDKARDRNELGTVSDIELLELENSYREKLQLRKIAEQQQRLSRLRLAAALGRPDDLPADLTMPEVDWKKPLPAIESVLEKSLANNPELQTSRNTVQAAKEKLKASQSSHNPVIHGEMQLAQYNRETGTSHPAMAGLVFEVPLYTGGASQAEIAGARAQLLQQQAMLQVTELSVRQAAVELVMQLETYKADLEAQQVSEDYTELYLDKNRALYELEVASDFGDATVRVSQVILKKLQTLLDYALTEARLAALQGEWLKPSSSQSISEGEQ